MPTSTNGKVKVAIIGSGNIGRNILTRLGLGLL